MQIQVLVAYIDDQGNPIWNYNHVEAVPFTNDAEQIALAARGLLDKHIDSAKESLAAQSETDFRQLQDPPK